MGDTTPPQAKKTIIFLAQKTRKKGTHNAEHCVSFPPILNGLVDDSVLSYHLVSASFGKVSHSGIESAEVYLGKPLVEEDFSRIELELEPELFIVSRTRTESAEQALYIDCGGSGGRELPKEIEMRHVVAGSSKFGLLTSLGSPSNKAASLQNP